MNSPVFSRNPTQLAKFLVSNVSEVNNIMKTIAHDEEIKAALVDLGHKIAERTAIRERKEEAIEISLVETDTNGKQDDSELNL